MAGHSHKSLLFQPGVSAGMDMSLAVIGRMFGQAERDRVCRQTEYTAQTDPNVDPFASLSEVVM